MPRASGVALARDGGAAELIKADALAGALDAQVGEALRGQPLGGRDTRSRELDQGLALLCALPGVLSASESTYPRRQRRALAVIVGVELEIQFEENGDARCLHRSSNDRTTLGRRWKDGGSEKRATSTSRCFCPALGRRISPDWGRPWSSPGRSRADRDAHEPQRIAAQGRARSRRVRRPHPGEPAAGGFLATRMYAEVVHHQSENLPADVDKIVEALYAQSTRAAERMRSLVAELESGRMPPSSPHRRAA